MERWESLVHRAQESRGRGDLPAALATLEEALGAGDLDPLPLATVHRMIAELHDYQDHIAEAEDHYLRALEAGGEEDEFGNQVVLSLHHTVQRFYASVGDEQKAAAITARLEVVLARTEGMRPITRVVAWGEGEPNARGRCFQMKARFLPCDEVLQAHRRSNTPASDCGLLGQYFHSKGWRSIAGSMYEFAWRQDVARFTRLHPAVATTLTHAAELHRELGNVPAAEAMEAEAESVREQLRARDAEALASGDPSALAAHYAQLGTEAEMASDFVLASSLYRLAMAHEPTDPQVWYFIHNNLGYCMNQRGRHAEAEELCRRAIAIDGARHNAYKNLGLALKGLGRLHEAARALLDSVRVCKGRDPRSYLELHRLIGEHPELPAGHPEVREWLKVAEEITIGEEVEG